MDNNKEILATKQRFGIIGNSEPLNDAIRRALLAAKVATAFFAINRSP